jgi:hypothetical protein
VSQDLALDVGRVVAERLAGTDPTFSTSAFLTCVRHRSGSWTGRIADCLHERLPSEYPRALRDAEPPTMTVVRWSLKYEVRRGNPRAQALLTAAGG